MLRLPCVVCHRMFSVFGACESLSVSTSQRLCSRKWRFVAIGSASNFVCFCYSNLFSFEWYVRSCGSMCNLRTKRQAQKIWSECSLDTFIVRVIDRRHSNRILCISRRISQCIVYSLRFVPFLHPLARTKNRQRFYSLQQNFVHSEKLRFHSISFNPYYGSFNEHVRKTCNSLQSIRDAISCERDLIFN